MKKYLILLIIISLFGLALRTVRLADRPLGFTWDEAALGYNAFSILKTARDEHGQLLPVIFRSFGDYKPGLYVYSAVPSVALFGLTEFATRLPSAVCGVLLIVATALFAWQFFGKKVSLVSAGLLAANPWALQFSRGAWEANFCLLLTLLGALLFIRKKFVLSAVLFGLTFWTYQGAKLFTPLLLLALLICFRPVVKKLFLPVVLLILFLIPVIVGFSSQSGRLVVLGVFSYTRPAAVIAQLLRQEHLTSPNFYFEFFHSELLDQTRGVVQRFLNHYSPQYLFFSGDWSDVRQSTPYFGYFYLPEIITFFLGLRFIFRRFTPISRFLLLWLVFAVVPSALSRDIVSGVRSLPEIIPLIIFSALGFARLLNHKFLLLLISGLTLFLFINYLDLYYILAPDYSADAWLYPYKPALMAIKPYLAPDTRVVMTNALGQPYIFVLFYYQVDPAQAQSQLATIPANSVDVGEVASLDQFAFQKFYWPAQRGAHATIFVGDQFELPEQDLHQYNLVRITDISYPNGTLAWHIVELK